MPLGTETVTITRTRSGKPVGGVAPIVTTTVVLEGCDVDPVGTEETLGSDKPVTDRYRVITADGDVHPEISESDTAEWRGIKYDVLGQPQHWYGVLEHSELILARAKG